MPNQQIVQAILARSTANLPDINACAKELILASQGAAGASAHAVGYAQMAIRYAIKAGDIMRRASDLAPRQATNEYLADVANVSVRTAQRWVRLSKENDLRPLLDNPNNKTITDAYRAAKVLPEIEPKAATATKGDTYQPPYVAWKERAPMDVWSDDELKDFAYEVEKTVSKVHATMDKRGLDFGRQKAV